MQATALATESPATPALPGNDHLLFGMVFGVLTFWLFAQTMLNVAPDMQRDLGVAAGSMNVAVSLTALFAGIFTVVMGNLADRVGRLRVMRLGFALSVIGSLLVALAPGMAFIRVGEKLLQRLGPRQPMLWGCLITGLAIILLWPANLLLAQYRVLALLGFTLFGVGLALYATPSTDAALSSLPPEQAGSGAGIYKMSSSLGSALGVAVSASIFSGVGAEGMPWLAELLPFRGRQDNLALREAAMVALGFNVAMVVLAALSVALTIPKGRSATA